MYLKEVSQSNLALGGVVKLSIVTEMSEEESTKMFGKLWKSIFLFERRFSRFLPDSELSAFNRAAGARTIISSEFKSLLTVAKDLSMRTGGLFNPFILPALQRAGYINSAAKGYENDAQEIHTNKKVVPIDRLKIGDSWASIPYGTAIDLGGCGKGYLADQLRGNLIDKKIKGYWLSLSGDIVTYGHDENGDPLRVAIQSAKTLKAESEWTIDCPNKEFSVATSGTFRRKSQSSSEDWHHIINPKTLEPADSNIQLVTVCADACVEADVLASCAVILGDKKAPIFLKSHGVSAALIQYLDIDGKHSTRSFGKYIKQGELVARHA